MTDNVGVRLRGLKQLDRALGKADKGLRKNLRDGLRDIAETGASEARSTATRKGLRASGDLIRNIRPFVRTGSVGIRSSATHGGFAYPLRLEYEDRQGGKYGPRATLGPALEHAEGDLAKDIEKWLDQLEGDFEGFAS